MARKRTEKLEQQQQTKRSLLNRCDQTKHCSCIQCWEAEHGVTQYEPEKPYDPLTAMDDLLEDSGYDPLNYFNK